jgi:hypothetical protein
MIDSTAISLKQEVSGAAHPSSQYDMFAKLSGNTPVGKARGSQKAVERDVESAATASSNSVDVLRFSEDAFFVAPEVFHQEAAGSGLGSEFPRGQTSDRGSGDDNGVQPSGDAAVATHEVRDPNSGTKLLDRHNRQTLRDSPPQPATRLLFKVEKSGNEDSAAQTGSFTAVQEQQINRGYELAYRASPCDPTVPVKPDTTLPEDCAELPIKHEEKSEEWDRISPAKPRHAPERMAVDPSKRSGHSRGSANPSAEPPITEPLQHAEIPANQARRHRPFGIPAHRCRY